ncbi:MAG TPA: LLM class flavin-dependent oxidoreductase [Ktedonobacteraceae bacterium]|nr:LLM class flavin-dependent oxidoreductase [Ktedonobacteraceae bacterium]
MPLDGLTRRSYTECIEHRCFTSFVPEILFTQEAAMRFALSIPQQVPDGTFDPIRLRDYLTRAEALGFHSAWTQEAVLGSAPTLAPLELMSFAAACTEQLRLGCAVFVSPLHNPLHLAKSISTLDQLSRGRVEVGIATGGKRSMFSAFDVDPTSFVARFTEGLQLMKRCWTDPHVTFAGRFWQLEDAAIEPKPFQKPYPPLWIGGSHPAAVRRALRYGSGFFGAGRSTTAQFAGQVQILRAALAEAAQKPSTFQIAKRVYIAIDDDTTRAQTRVDAALQRIYGVSGLTGIAVYGPPSACIAGLRAVADAGAELILLNLLFEETEQMERLAAEVISHMLHA